jgi:hypothetical protein
VVEPTGPFCPRRDSVAVNKKKRKRDESTER